MKEIIVKSQTELDAIPSDYDGKIIIKFGTPYNRAQVNRQFTYPVMAYDNSSVGARDNSFVVAYDNSSVEARDNSSVEARDNSSVEARDNSSVEARDNSSVVAWGNSSVVAWGNSSVVAWDNSSVVAWGNSSVVAYDNSSVGARDNSSVVAWDNSSVEAWGNSQITDRQRGGTINTAGNARIVHDPKTIEEYINSIGGVEQSETTVKLYKAVRKKNGRYFSDHNRSFEYVIGETAVADALSEDPLEDCGHGIHMADKMWCASYGRNWNDLAILEVEVEKAGVIVPRGGCGKVRARSVKVIREIPLEECGLLGKMLAGRRKNDGH